MSTEYRPSPLGSRLISFTANKPSLRD